MKNLKVEVAYRAAMAQLRNFIEKNELRPGDRLPTETELAQTMGISRGTVREALKALEALGIVETKRGEGMFVQAFSFQTILRNIPCSIVFNPRELLELLEVRKALECQFVRSIATELTEHKQAKLREYLAAMKECVSTGDVIGNREVDYVFHNELYSDLGNGLLLELINTFVEFMNEAGIGATTDTDLRENYEAHLRLIQAIEDGDPDRTSQCMADHFAHAEKRVKRYLENLE